MTRTYAFDRLTALLRAIEFGKPEEAAQLASELAVAVDEDGDLDARLRAQAIERQTVVCRAAAAAEAYGATGLNDEGRPYRLPVSQRAALIELASKGARLLLAQADADVAAAEKAQRKAYRAKRSR